MYCPVVCIILHFLMKSYCTFFLFLPSLKVSIIDENVKRRKLLQKNEPTNNSVHKQQKYYKHLHLELTRQS